jgi:hypothetical protein
VRVADLNKDGKPDLVASNTSAANVFLGNGDGSFQSPKSYALGGSSSSGLAIGSVNNAVNAHLDAVALTQTTSALKFLSGNGNGAFAAATTLALTGTPVGLALGDLDSDGDLDAFFGLGSTLARRNNNGSGVFTAVANVTTCTGPLDVVTADFNKDGRADAAVLCAASFVRHLSTGAAFGAQASLGALTNGRGIAAGDMNNDGNPDVVASRDATGTANDVVFVALGKGDGTFNAATSMAAGATPGAMALADFDLDGKLDVALINGAAGTNALQILFGNGAGGAKKGKIIGLPAGITFSRVEAADLNGDGKPDLVFTTNIGLAILLSTAS